MRESKTSQPSSKHTCRPMGARVVAQLFYNYEQREYILKMYIYLWQKNV